MELSDVDNGELFIIVILKRTAMALYHAAQCAQCTFMNWPSYCLTSACSLRIVGAYNRAQKF